MMPAARITFRGVERSEALEDRIRDGAGKLAQFHPRITGCHVIVEQSDRHHHQGRRFGVHVEVRVPGRRDAISTLHHHEDAFVAVRDAFDSVRRQLEDIVREARGDVKRHEEKQHGKVARVYADEGYGFIVTEDGRELYFSRENVVHPPFKDLLPDDEVQFVEEPAGDGAQAHRVSIGKHGFRP